MGGEIGWVERADGRREQMGEECSWMGLGGGFRGLDGLNGIRMEFRC